MSLVLIRQHVSDVVAEVDEETAEKMIESGTWAAVKKTRAPRKTQEEKDLEAWLEAEEAHLAAQE